MPRVILSAIRKMDAQRWKRIEQIFDQVISSPAGGRAAILDESCGSDSDLRREIEELLDAHADSGDFLSPGELPAHIAEVTPDTSYAPGALVGPYEILSILGAGAMGEVFRARDTRLAREVALKMLPRHLTADRSGVTRFQSEARAASALNHPNTVTIYEIGEAGGAWYLAAELIPGRTLRERLAEGTLPLAEILSVGRQCAAALSAAHEAGIVHRDIKPENIMLRPDCVVKIVDFGLARILEPRPGFSVNATQTGTIMGTPRYMSPEQARGERSDPRSDIFSLGAVLYEMAAGQPAFPGATLPEVFAALLSREPELARAGRLGPLLARALAKDPEARYQTMREFETRLRHFDPGSLSNLAAVTAHRALPLGNARRALLALGLLGAAAATGYFWTSRAPASPGTARFVPLAPFPGPKRSPVISPDGTRVAFSWQPQGSRYSHLFVKPLHAGEPRQLTDADYDDIDPLWSPDGARIVFTRQISPDSSDTPQEMYLIPASGGEARKIVTAWRGASFAPDGDTIAFTRPPRPGGPTEPEVPGGVFLHSLRTGQSRDLTFGPSDSYPVFSPDGKWITFKRRHSGSAAQLYVVAAAGGAVRQITFDPLQPSRAPTWTPDSREVVFATLRSGADGSMWRVPVTGGAARPLSATLRDVYEPSISPLWQMAYREEWIDTNLYLLKAKAAPGGGRADYEAPVLAIEGSREDHSPAFSPDGERIAFVSERSGNLEIWTARRDGAQAAPLTHLRAQNTGTPRWSPDGRQIAFDSWATGKSEIYVVDAAGGTPRQLTSGTLASWMPAWSPDGKWLYCSRGLARADAIWRLPATGGDAVPISGPGAYEAYPSPDGERLYFSREDGKGGASIWFLPAAGGAAQPVPELQSYNRIRRSWGVIQDGIFFLSREDTPRQTVRLLHFRTRKIESLFTLDKQRAWGINALALTPDARYAMATQLDHTVNELMMLENFR